MITSVQSSQQAYQVSDNQNDSTPKTPTEFQIALAALYGATCHLVYLLGISALKSKVPFPNKEALQLMKDTSSLASNLEQYNLPLSDPKQPYNTMHYLLTTSQSNLNEIISGKASTDQEKHLDLEFIHLFGYQDIVENSNQSQDPYAKEMNKALSY